MNCVPRRRLSLRRGNGFPGNACGWRTDLTIEPSNEPFEIAAEGEHVVIDGPGGLAATLTSHAAADTSDKLLDASIKAAGRMKIRKDVEEDVPRPTHYLTASTSDPLFAAAIQRWFQGDKDRQTVDLLNAAVT